MIQQLHRVWRTSVSMAGLVAAGVLLNLVLPRPGLGADEIRFSLDGAQIFSLSMEELATFAQTGEMTDNLKTYTGFINPKNIDFLRQGLTYSIPLDAATIAHLTQSPLGRDALFNVGKVVQASASDANGAAQLRSGVMGAATANPQGWTLIDALRQMPTPTIEIQVGKLLKLQQALSVYFAYNDAVVEAIQAQAVAEMKTQPALQPAALADLSEPGSYRVVKETVTVENPAVRQTRAGLTVNYDFPVDLYLPQGLSGPAPIVIISHGFGDVKDSFTFMAEHVASHGFVAILPNHVGSDLSYRKDYLKGRLNTLLSPMEFLNRPQEITFLIDELEQLVKTSPIWANRLNVNQIGVMGDSFGGLTALGLAGAEINYARLTQSCDYSNVILNFSLYLECRARFLPPQNLKLRDERIKAVVVTHPLGGHLYGPEGMGQIEVPLLMISGSEDIVAPLVTEQVHPFIWMRSTPKYLALLKEGTHFSSKPGRADVGEFLELLVGKHRDVGTRYSKTLNVAFWQAYLQGKTEALTYLTASYGKAASQGQPMQLTIIQSLSEQRLATAYGDPPPIPVNPPAIAPTPPPRDESVLAEIKRTGVIKVAFRKDAAPFGYINPSNEWDGYCGEMAIALSKYLSQTLKTAVAIELVELTSTLQNRFDLVRNGSVHLECGPNTIRQAVKGITFSRPIFITSAQFLAPKGQGTPINPKRPLTGMKLGVLPDTTTETFVKRKYPQAEIVQFPGLQGRQAAVQAVSTQQIDAFVGDGVLSYAELERQNLSITDFSLTPEQPLTCEYYGLILPDDDPAWKIAVDQFVRSQQEEQVYQRWFKTLYPQLLDATEYCLNQ